MSKLFGRLWLLIAIVAAIGVYQFNDISTVRDPDLLRLAKQVLSDRFQGKTLEDLSTALRSGDSFDIAGSQSSSVATQEVDVLAARESRSLLPWKHSKEVILQVDFALKIQNFKV